MTPAWNRRDDEGGQAYAAFRAYLELGAAKRSHTAVAAAVSKSRAIVGRWSAEHDWVERSAAWDSAQTAVLLEQLQRTIAKSVERSGELYERMFGKAIEGLDALAADELSAADILRLSGGAIRQAGEAYDLATRQASRENGREAEKRLEELLRGLAD